MSHNYRPNMLINPVPGWAWRVLSAIRWAAREVATKNPLECLYLGGLHAVTNHGYANDFV